jgi:iron complex transport system substrate-binding protein
MSALGVAPVGYLDDFSTIAGEPAPWSVEVPESATVLDPGGDLAAQIAALKPDLILASSYASSEADFDAMSRIAPTLPNLTTVGPDSWSAQLDILGKIMDKQPQAQELIDGFKKRMAEMAAQYPNLEGETFLKVSVDSPSTVSVLASGADSPTRLLGMIRPKPFDETLEKTYSITLPFSRIKELNADVLFVMGTADLQTTFREAEGYDNLLAVKRDTILFLDPVMSLAVNRPSILSLPWVLTQTDALFARADAFGAPLATGSPDTTTTEPER